MSADKRPFQVVSRRLGAQNSRLRIWFDHLRSDDNSVPDFLVVEPKGVSADMRGGVAVLPVVQGGGVVLVRVFRHAIDRWGWEVPRGFVDEGESPGAAARRELTEETGLVCRGEWIANGAFAPEPGILRTLTEAYTATGCVPGPEPLQDEIGLTETRVFGVDDMLNLEYRSEVYDALTTILLDRYLFSLRDSTPGGSTRS